MSQINNITLALNSHLTKSQSKIKFLDQKCCLKKTNCYLIMIHISLYIGQGETTEDVDKFNLVKTTYL